MTKQALPHGIPIILMNASNPKNHHINPIRTPPNRNQIIFPIAFTKSPHPSIFLISINDDSELNMNNAIIFHVRYE